MLLVLISVVLTSTSTITLMSRAILVTVATTWSTHGDEHARVGLGQGRRPTAAVKRGHAGGFNVTLAAAAAAVAVAVAAVVAAAAAALARPSCSF